MTRTTPRPGLRRSAAGLAAAGLLTAGSFALAAPVHAADPVFTLGGPAETAVHTYPASGKPSVASVPLTVNNPSEDEEGGGFESEYTITLDLSGVQGVADVTFDSEAGDDCEVTGTTAVCQDWGIYPGLSGIADLRVTAAKGSEDGDTGTIAVTGSADGATFTPFTTRITVGGPDLVMKQIPFTQQNEPGDSQQAPLSFTNKGTRAADGVLLTLMYSSGLELPGDYSNCEYGRSEFAWMSTVLCSFPGSYEPGATYTLDTPLTVVTGEHAYIDTLIYRVGEDGPAQRAAQRSGASFEKGAGPALTLKKAPTARSGDLNPSDNQQEIDFLTKNTADFVAYGDALAGEAGETVTAELGFRNEGPAWIGYVRSGESVGTVDFTVPEGASVTAKPESCRGVTAKGAYREQQLGAPRYFCDSSMTVPDGADIALPFELKIDQKVADAAGSVTVRGGLFEPEFPFDPKNANNTARVVLNGTGPTDGGAEGGSDGGTDGGTDAGGSEGSGTTGGASATPSAAAASPAGDGTSGGPTTQTGTEGGGLASTGTAVATVSAVGAAALLAGGALFVVARRRARQG
ncbi:peptidase [uncultured Streptomyces sp.]|uniref:peptidase n=1 Tax=uncultured Streptomyces sp. TaxID=174707 RepID=UPI002605DCCA|nr:peptidase [uncultured Streptomyces sp.]